MIKAQVVVLTAAAMVAATAVSATTACCSVWPVEAGAPETTPTPAMGGCRVVSYGASSLSCPTGGRGGTDSAGGNPGVVCGGYNSDPTSAATAGSVLTGGDAEAATGPQGIGNGGWGNQSPNWAGSSGNGGAGGGGGGYYGGGGGTGGGGDQTGGAEAAVPTTPSPRPVVSLIP